MLRHLERYPGGAGCQIHSNLISYFREKIHIYENISLRSVVFDICNSDSLMCTMANFSRFLLLTQFRPRTHFHITMTMRHNVRRLVFQLLLLQVSTSHCATRRSCDHLQQTMAGSHPLPTERGWKVRFACRKVVCYSENIYRMYLRTTCENYKLTFVW